MVELSAAVPGSRHEVGVGDVGPDVALQLAGVGLEPMGILFLIQTYNCNFAPQMPLLGFLIRVHLSQ